MRSSARRSARAAGAVGLLLLTTSCGGTGSGEGPAGDDTLYVSIHYDQGGSLLRETHVDPVLSGFEGHAPRCRLARAGLAAGLVLNADCSITGVPTEAGAFSFAAKVGAEGVSNEVHMELGFVVYAPSVTYDLPFYVGVGGEISASPARNPWTPAAGEALTYAVVEGALPRGLVLSPSSGQISGRVLDEPGNYGWRVRATLTAGGLSASLEYPFGIRVDPIEFRYSDSAYMDWYVSATVERRPFLSTTGDGVTFTLAGDPLPAGVAFDTSTGAFHGVPTAETGWLNHQVTARIALGAEAVTLTRTIRLHVVSPVYVRYRYPVWPAVPDVSINVAVTNPVLTYSVPAGCTLKAGVTLDPVTGVLAGQEPPAGQGPLDGSNCDEILVTVTHNGVAFPVLAAIG